MIIISLTLHPNSVCSAPISALAWSLSGEYVVSVDKSRRAVLWSDIWHRPPSSYQLKSLLQMHSLGCHQNTAMLGKAHALHSAINKSRSVVLVVVAKKLCHSKAQTHVLMIQGSGDYRVELAGFCFETLLQMNYRRRMWRTICRLSCRLMACYNCQQTWRSEVARRTPDISASGIWYQSKTWTKLEQGI